MDQTPRIRAGIALLAAALLLAGCFSPDLGSGSLACGPNGSCPADYECGVDNRCYPKGKSPTDAGNNHQEDVATDTTVGDDTVADDTGGDDTAVADDTTSPDVPPDTAAGGPRLVVTTTGGGGNAGTTERSAQIAVGQSIASGQVESGERSVSFGIRAQ